MNTEIQATARVQIAVEIQLTQPWDEHSPIGQLYRQAAEQAKAKLLESLKPGHHGIVSICGEPKVLGVITERQ